ncbi:unnamed protein product [Eruca vesicaria subsp. sativa]|uniref:Uncharacterized protein n=1 Tax=Eruca vesicaria subsp. sativa TaxID=29727 RepID=A0ABC8IPZ6_ERUVS|nr:unnamed protein product [Eruca vesicaria subsp. sativa]
MLPLARSLPISPETTVLNVVSSLQQTQHILSIDPTRSSLTHHHHTRILDSRETHPELPTRGANDTCHLRKLAKEVASIKAKSFSYCFGRVSISTRRRRRDGSPLVRNSEIVTSYYVGLGGFSVGGQQVSISAPVFAVDASGTAVTRLQTQAYNSLRDAFVKLKKGPVEHLFVRHLLRFIVSLHRESPDGDVSFHPGTFCLAFAPTSSSLLLIMGNVQQQGDTYHLGSSESSYRTVS